MDYINSSGKINIGKITRPHGLKGEVKIHIYSGNLDFFLDCTHLIVGELGLKAVKAVRKGGQFLLVLFSDYISKDPKELINQFIFVQREHLRLKEDEFLIEEHKGLNIFEVSQNKVVGKIKDYIKGGGNDFFEVVLLNKKKILISCFDDSWGEVDLKQQQVILNDYKGILHFAL